MGVVYVKEERARARHTAEASWSTFLTFPLRHTTRSLEVLNTIWSSGFPPIRSIQAVVFVRSAQIICSWADACLALCVTAVTCLFHPAALSQLKRKILKSSWPLTLTLVFLLNTHENTHSPDTAAPLSYFSQIPSCVLLPVFERYDWLSILKSWHRLT